MYTLELSPEQMDKLQDLIESGNSDNGIISVAYSLLQSGKTQCRRLQKRKLVVSENAPKNLFKWPRTANHWRGAATMKSIIPNGSNSMPAVTKG